MAEIPNARFLFNLIFFLVILSVLFQGRTLSPLAKFLKLSHDEPSREEIHQSGNAPGLPTGQPQEQEADNYKTTYQYLSMAWRCLTDHLNAYCDAELGADQKDGTFRSFLRRLRTAYRKQVCKLRNYCLADEQKEETDKEAPEEEKKAS